MRLSAFLSIAVFAAGCSSGPPSGEVSGTVSIEGTLLERGSIGFVPADGNGQTAGGEIKAGQYIVKSSVGIMKVEIRAPKVVGKQKDYDAPGGKWYPLEEESLPAKYNDETVLTLEVKAGTNQKSWDLKKK
ncbi:MAG: hypothetical protein L0215_25315 [Gemmataceae bacterium]|nr:hypothetical protein [Gemmataceae bacterium]